MPGSGQPVVAALVEPGTRTVVGSFGGPVAGTGLAINLAAGQRLEIRVVVGTWRCDGELGSALPPGTYGVRAGIGPDGGSPVYLARGVRFRVTR
jgi:hypothetical protein